MYLARFDLGGVAVAQALVHWPDIPASQPLPQSFGEQVRAMLASTHLELAARIVVDADRVHRTWMLYGQDFRQRELEQAALALRRMINDQTGRVVFPADAAHHDMLAAAFPASRLWIDTGGYRTPRGTAMYPEFAVGPAVQTALDCAAANRWRIGFQANLRRTRLSGEDVRALKKALVRIDEDPAIPAPMKRLQRTLAARLQKPTWSAECVFGGEHPAAMANLQRIVDEEFGLQMRAYGFDTAPFGTWELDGGVEMGLHSSVFEGKPALAFAADVVDDAAMESLLAMRPALVDAPSPARQHAATRGWDVFISYSSRDAHVAQALCHGLESQAIRCWLAPRNILPSESYPDAIMRGIRLARVLVLVLSGSSNLSAHVQREVERALNQGCPILPVRIEDMTPSGPMEYLISTCHWLDAAGRSVDSTVEELVASINALLQR